MWRFIGIAATLACLASCTPVKDEAPPPHAAKTSSKSDSPEGKIPEEQVTEVQYSNVGGTFVVPVLINKTITLNFTVDSGASDVSIPADVAMTLIRAGTITSADFIGRRTFTLADGSIVPSAEFRIRTLRIGNLELHDVTGSLAAPSGTLLLGQSFLTRLSTWSIDNQRHVLILKARDLEISRASESAPAQTTDSSQPASPEIPRPAKSKASDGYPKYASTIPKAFWGRWDELISDGCEGRESRFEFQGRKFSHFEDQWEVTRVKLYSPTEMDLDLTMKGEGGGQIDDSMQFKLVDRGATLTGRRQGASFFKRCPS